MKVHHGCVGLILIPLLVVDREIKARKERAAALASKLIELAKRSELSAV